VASLLVQDDRLAKLQQSAAKLQQSMESAASRFSRLDKAVLDLTQRMGQLDKEISAIKGRAETGFAALAAKMDENAEAADRQLDGRLAEHGRGLTSVEGTLGTVAGRLGSVDGKVGTLGTRVEDLQDILAKMVDAAQDDVTTRLGSLEETVLTLAEALLRPQA